MSEAIEFNDQNQHVKKINTLEDSLSLVFFENKKGGLIKDQLQEDDDDSDQQQDVEIIGGPSPAEIKIKIKKSLLEFRCKVQDAILGNYLLGAPNVNIGIALTKEKLRDITLWGVPLLPSKAHEGTDVVFRKFLKAKDYKVNDAFDLLQKTLVWRLENNIDGILDEDLGSEFENAGFLDSRDKEGRPVCYHVFDVFRDKNVYKKTFEAQQRCDMFLRWRIQLMESAIQKLSFKGGVDSIIQVYDLKNTPIQGTKELSSLCKKALLMFQTYYPEIVYKSIVVYAPFWFYTSQVLFSRIMNQRNKKKFILVRPHQVTKTLLKFIAPEHLPAEYGGLRRNNDKDFSPDDKVLELKVKGNSVSIVEFPVHEPGVTVMWDITVVGWDVSYKEEFIPDDEGSYNILIQNQSIVGDSTRNSFYINEPGKILITVENATFKKKKLFYRSKTRATIPMFILLS